MLVGYSPCGRYLAASIEADIVVLGVETRNCLKKSTFHKATITVLKFASSSTIVSGSKDNAVAVWDWEVGDTPLFLRGHTDVVWDIAMSSDGTEIFSASGDCTVKLWNLAGGEVNQNVPSKRSSPPCVCLSRFYNYCYVQ